MDDLLRITQGRGHYVGVYMARGEKNNGWWEKGEITLYLDGGIDWPTICGKVPDTI